MEKKWKKNRSKMTQICLKMLLRCWFRVSVKGGFQPRPKSLIIANKTSTIDLLLLCLFVPERLTIVLPPNLPANFWLKLALRFTDALILDSTHPTAGEVLANAIEAENLCVVFPEGVVGQEIGTESLYHVTAAAIEETRSCVIPIRIEGAQHSIFSLNKDKNSISLFPKINLHIQPFLSLFSSGHRLVEKDSIQLQLFQLISEMYFANRFKVKSLFQALIEGSKLGNKHDATIEDSNRTPLTYNQFRARCFILGRQIKDQTKVNEHVGIMMPTTTAGMVTFFALQAYRRLPAMLNFSAGFYNLFSACTTAGIKTIYTSRQFVETAQLQDLIKELQDSGLTIRFLEDFKSTIHLGHKLSGLIKGMFPNLANRLIGKKVDPEDMGLILFTSGSEGIPKGVALSHANILANCYQMMSRVDFSAQDVFFNSLPIFHCFGLTAGSILPLVAGMNCFLYPSPLHYKIIPGLVRESKGTIMFGTDTFLNGYARAAAADDFASVRYIFAGAEKVKPETTKHWAEHLGVTVYEGYGATEAAPVISLNCPLASKPGSVGMILPFMESKLVPVDGIAEGGRLLLRGPNVMCGYISKDGPDLLDVPNDGWHDTGDIVTMDENGFITIVGRAKRFAKIAGEMVSLTAVEGIAAAVWPELLNAAVIIKLPEKGEKILLFSEATEADKSSFVKMVRELGYSEILVPYKIIPDSKIPVLASGKIDYLTLEDELSEFTALV